MRPDSWTLVGRRLATAAVLIMVVAACGPPAGTLYHVTISAPDGSHPLPVTLGDQTNVVVAMEAGEQDPSGSSFEPSVKADPRDPRILDVHWWGGACEAEAVLAFSADREKFILNIQERAKLALGGCPAVAVSRSVRISTSKAIPVDSITVIGGK